MSEEAIWRVFTETGDPAAYLLYRSAREKQGRSDQDRNGSGEQPRPAD